MKKLLFVINTLGGGGAERALLELLGRLEKREDLQVSLYVLLPQGRLARELPAGVRLLNRRLDPRPVLDRAGRRALMGKVAVALLRNGALPEKLRLLRRGWRETRGQGRLQPDKLLWPAVALGGERFDQEFDLAVAWLEGGSAYYVADHVRARKKAAVIHVDHRSAGYTRGLDGGCWESFDRVFAVSEETRKQFLEVYPEQAAKTGVLPNLVDQERIRRLARELGGFADGWQGLRMLTVGRLTYQKAYDVAIDAMALLKKQGCPVRWYVLGEGELRDSLEKKLAALGLAGDFLLPGAVENPYPYYAQADLYVHATRYEGRSIAIQEAQTLGCPVLASDCPGNRQQVADGIDGRLCPLTPEGIAAVAGELLSDKEERRRLGRAAAEKRFPEDQLRELLALLEEEGRP